MKTSHQLPRNRALAQQTLLVKALIGVFTMVSVGHAQTTTTTNDWISGDISADTSWSAGVVNQVTPDPVDPNQPGTPVLNVINSSGAQWDVRSANPRFRVDLGLQIGSGAAGDLSVSVGSAVFPADFAAGVAPYNGTPSDPTLRIGTGGGTGNLLLDISSSPSSGFGMGRIDANYSSLGVDMGGNGTATVLGAGKDPNTLYGLPTGVLFSYKQGNQNQFVGQGGGSGTVDINGAGLALMHSNGTPASATSTEPEFAVGTGPGSVGTVNVLNTGKLMASSPYANGPNDGPYVSNNIGKDGGTGRLNVQGTTDMIAVASGGLTVGSGGGKGFFDLLGSGKIVSGQIDRSDLCTPPAKTALSISADGASTGIVRAGGAHQTSSSQGLPILIDI